MTWNLKRSLCMAALLAAACNSVEPRTEVMLIVDADDNMRGKIASLQAQIEGSLEGSTAADATTYTASFDPHDPAGAGWPLRFALTPRGGAQRRRYKITLSALDAAKQPIAVLRSEGGFVKGKTLALSMRFDASCLGKLSLECPASETCANGKCVSASVDANALPALSQIDGGMLPPTGTVSEPVSAAGSGGASGAGHVAGSGGAGAGAIQTGVSDCGDGLLGPEEKCDTMIPAQQLGACPTECPPQQACESLKLEGSGCQAHCTGTPITVAVPDDGCCPPGADSSSDSDCLTQCGNGKIEKGETCDPPSTCPTLETCIAANVCLKPVIVGAPSTCDAVCIMQPIDQCLTGDGCCPSSCARAQDADCSPSCGDGMVDPMARETCEPTNPAAQCKTSCDDGDACSVDLLTGSPNNCNVTCTYLKISNPFPLDGCCPPGANANNDSDCMATCGNGIVERGERCDGACPEQCDDSDACTRDALVGRDCGRQCTHSNIGPSTGATDGCCPAGANATNDSDCEPVCGNGVVERDERCDGNNCPTQQSCNDDKPCTADVITGSGCGRQCVHNNIGANRSTPDGCCPNGMNMDMDADCPPAAPVCGNGKRETGELCDGADCPTAESCDDKQACTRDEVVGEPCQRQCMHSPRTANPTTSDGCCPTNNDKWQDIDCPARCGNGHKEMGELCDGTDCPTAASCRDTNNCTEDSVTGSACQLVCAHDPIGAKPSPADQCCPPSTDKWQDTDCNARCGNSHIEIGEDCDPPNGSTCDATCNNVVIIPPPPTDGGT